MSVLMTDVNIQKIDFLKIWLINIITAAITIFSLGFFIVIIISIGYNYIFLAFLLLLLFIMPIRLNNKFWYFEAYEKNNPSIADGYNIFCNLKKYINTVFYLIVKYILIILGALVTAPPIAIIIILYKTLDRSIIPLGISFLVLFIVSIIMLIISAVYYIEYCLGFFCSDYIFFKSNNIFYSIKMSFKAMKNKRLKIFSNYIFCFILCLLCIFVVPIFFVLPYIKTFINSRRAYVYFKTS